MSARTRNASAVGSALREAGSARADVVNGLALLLTLILASLGATLARSEAGRGREARTAGERALVDATDLIDARGQVVPVRRYERIVSLNPVADLALVHLVEPQRLLAVSDWSRNHHPEGWRHQDRVGVESAEQIEAVIELQPDLVIVSGFADEARVTRLREQGIVVFDLGEMRGAGTLPESLTKLAILVGEQDRGVLLRRALGRDLEALDRRVPEADRPRGIYLTVVGDAMFGGTRNTSYGDVLRYGGVRDIAAEAGYVDWPRYGREELLALDPEVIITQPGTTAVLCGDRELAQLSACGPDGLIVEITGAWHSDPGLGFVEAAHDVMEAVHGSRLAP